MHADKKKGWKRNNEMEEGLEDQKTTASKKFTKKKNKWVGD